MEEAQSAWGVKQSEYKLGMGVVVNMDSSAETNAQVDATVAAVVTDASGKIVSCRLDVARNKMNVTDGAVDTEQTFKTRMELGSDYGMAGNPYSSDNNGDGKVLECTSSPLLSPTTQPVRLPMKLPTTPADSPHYIL